MSERSQKEQEAVKRLVATLADDVLNLTDSEVLAEALEDDHDTSQIVSEALALFEKTTANVKKAKLLAAKTAIAKVNDEPAQISDIDRDRARFRYDAILENETDLRKKMTLAARKEKGTSERDIESAIDDLAELGAFDEEGESDA